MEKRRFVIPQVTDKTMKKEEPIEVNPVKKPYIEKPEQFVSSMYGSKVKDVDYYPQSDFNNNGKQYKFLKETGVSPEEYQGYCVPKQEEFYGYAPINNDPKPSVNEEIKTYEGSMPNYNQNNGYVNNQNNGYNDNQNNGNYNIPNQNVNNQYNNPNQGYANNYSASQQRPYNPYEELNNQNNGYVNNPNNYSTVNGGYQDNRFSSQEKVEPARNENPYNELAKQVVNPMSGMNRIDDFTEDEPTTIKSKPITNDKIGKYETLKREKKSAYKFPDLRLLKRKNPNAQASADGIERQKNIINETLVEFGIGGQVVDYQKGPTVTLFEVKLNSGVFYSKVSRIQQQLQGNLEAIAIRVFAPIPGKSTVGIEVPNDTRENVFFGDMISNEAFYKDGNPMNVILGVDISNENQYVNIIDMPHCLIAGCTKSGKSVCVNTILMSIIYKAHPDDVKLILIDPKKVEFMKYNGLPHLATPVITDPKLAIATMKWLVDEMEDRYDYFASIGVGNFQEYLQVQKGSVDAKHIPYLVLVIDEFADLVSTGGSDIEQIVSKLCAKARAAGIHLIIATQRPSVDVISGTIKANIPTRIAFKVQKAIDSSIILDKTGAENLLGNGDMLYYNDMGKECRIQGAYVSNEEIKNVVNSISTGNIKFVFTQEELQKSIEAQDSDDVINDPKFVDVARYIVQTQNASINRIQKVFNFSFNRVQPMIEKLAELGVVGENVGSRARAVLMEPDDLEDVLNSLR